MIVFVLGIIADLLSGATKARLAAAEAFDTPPRTPQARRWRMIALSLFMSASLLLLAAAIAFVVEPRSMLNEILGWSGIACFQLCVMCGLRYAAINNE